MEIGESRKSGREKRESILKGSQRELKQES